MRPSQLLVVLGVATQTYAQSSFTPLRPPSLPLAVKSPYLSTWQQAGSDGGNGGYLNGQWPTFWQGQITGWAGYVRVDNITYAWLGDPAVSDEQTNFATQTSYEYTSTQSIFQFNVAGVVGLQATFISPVLPNTLLEMSLPYSYLDVSVYSIDGKEHEVQIYTDITAEWVSGDRGAIAQWSYGTYDGTPEAKDFPPVPSPTYPASSAPKTFATDIANPPVTTSIDHGPSPKAGSGPQAHPTGASSPPTDTAKTSNLTLVQNSSPGGVAFHRVWRQTQLEFTETDQQADWGYWYYATDNVQNLTYQIGENNTVREQFVDNGFLDDSVDEGYRSINDHQPVFGFAIDLGTINNLTNVSNVFQLSIHQQNCILFEGASGNTSVPCLWTNYFSNDTEAAVYFYQNYEQVYAESLAVDNQVAKDSVQAAGQNYLSLTSLSVRQAFGALAYTNSPTEPYVFLKEISSDGDTQTVDVIFPFHPILIYFNSTILRYMLDPLYINQEAGYFPYMFSTHDLGVWPNATGYNNVLVSTEKQPVEECGNMLIMTLAYAQRNNDNAYLAEHYDLLKQWNNYLVTYALNIGTQLSTDDFLGDLVNDTNLAIKGIIGIEAMAQIANRTGHTEDGQNFTQIAHSYINQWYGRAVSDNVQPEHADAMYYNYTSNGLLYNLFGDAELGLQLVKQEIYDIQSAFYPTVFKEYGVPLRSIGQDTIDTKLDWQLFVTALAENTTQIKFLDTITNWLNVTPTNFGFTDLYNTETANFGVTTFICRPVVGGTFSLLALQSAPQTGYINP